MPYLKDNKQERCPYTCELLGLQNVNREHILPYAIGAPSNFTLMACASENSKYNKLIDAPFSNDPLIRLISTMKGVRSRSGPVSFETMGKDPTSGEDVILRITSNDLNFRFKKPTERTGNNSYLVRGFGDSVHLQAQEIEKNFKRKNSSKLVKAITGPVTSYPCPELQFNFDLNARIYGLEMAKIAYLLTVDTFGDEAILGKSGQQFRSAINNMDIETMMQQGAKIGTFNAYGMNAVEESSYNNHYHLLLCQQYSASELITVIILFGIFTKCFVTSAEGLSIPKDFDRQIVIDPVTRTIDGDVLL